MIILLIVISLSLKANAQASKDKYYQTKVKYRRHYVHVADSMAVVYRLSQVLDKAGIGDLITLEDTLRSSDQFVGKNYSIESNNNELYLVAGSKKYLLKEADEKTASENLNNGYYLKHFFRISREVNAAYPFLNDFSFRDGFFRWKLLSEKNMEHAAFRKFTDDQLLKIRDSINAVHHVYASRTDYIIQNIRTIDYAVLKDSLVALPYELYYPTRYFATVIENVATCRPELFFRLAADLPDKKSHIYSSANRDKQLVKQLKAVEGYDDLKKEFIRSGRTWP